MTTRHNMMLDNLMRLNRQGQMTREEYAYVASFLGNVNFLVFGCGNDSNYWRYSNQHGFTCFLEHHKKWAKGDHVYVVEYRTKARDYIKLLERFGNGDEACLVMNLPDIVRKTKWDCIFVDSPEGDLGSAKAPGRMQSIYEASRLAGPDTHLFLHDTDRKVEKLYGDVFFGGVVKSMTKLKHYRSLKGPE
jgi:uncharacterized protein (TIGR01627 family)